MLCFVQKIHFKRSNSLQAKKGFPTVQVDVPLGEGFKDISCEFRPIFFKSRFFTVTYDVPFDLNVQPPPKGFPAPIVSKDSSNADGEKEG